MKYPKRIYGTNEDRFWAKVDKRLGMDACWEWLGYRDVAGYGRVRRNVENFAHRCAWHFTNGPIPEGRKVLHRCDNRPCCNPAHHFLGNQLDNMRDCRDKARLGPRKGFANGRCKMTPELLTAIHRRLRETSGKNQYEIAAEFGLGQSHVSRIWSGRVWKEFQK